MILYASFGGGHKSAADSLKKELEKDKNNEVIILDGLDYTSRIINKISINFFSAIYKMPRNVWNGIYNSSNTDTLSTNITYVLKLMAIKMIKIIREFSPNIIISTHPFCTQAVAYLKKKKKFELELSSIITDFEIHKLWYKNHENIDKIFVSSEEMKNDLILEGIDSSKVFVTGIPIKSEFNKNFDKAEICKKFGFDKNKKTILCFAGGGTGVAYKKTFALIEYLIKNFNNFNIIIISGKNKKTANKLKKIISANYAEDYTFFYEFTPHIPEMMYISEFIVSKAGGLTISEAIALGIPLFIIEPLPGQEIANTRYLVKNHAALFFETEYAYRKVFEDLVKSNFKELEFLKENSKKIGHINATSDIVKEVLNKEY